jgi:predicted nucleotidyltransferase
MTDQPTDEGACLDRAIVEALTYADLFDWPLAPTEIHRYLPISAGLDEVEAALVSLRLAERITSDDGLFALAGRPGLAGRRRRRAALSARLWPRAVRFAKAVASLPSVRLVGLTGSLAVGAADNEADVDLLVITDDGRLWLSRALTIGFVRLAAVRDVHLCPNYFVADSAVELTERDRFTAHELAQLVPICGPAAYRDLLERNAWYREFLPNHPGYTGSIEEPGPGLVRRLLRPLLGIGLLDRVERWEMQRKVARLTATMPEAVLRGEARFDATTCKGHSGEHRRRVLERLRVDRAESEEAAA